MNAVLVSKEHLDYVSKKSGKPVKGWAITFLKSRRNKSETFVGYDVDDFFFRDEEDLFVIALESINPGDHFELKFDFDGNYRYLEEIVFHEADYLDFSKPI